MKQATTATETLKVLESRNQLQANLTRIKHSGTAHQTEKQASRV